MNMHKLLISLLFFTTLFTNATEDTATFTIHEDQIKFYNYPEMRLTVSKLCPEAQDKKLCKELLFLNTISMNKIPLEKKKDKNPSSAVCTELLKGKVYIGIDKDNNENSFCKIENNIYIDGGTLSYYADKNDGIVQKPRTTTKPNKSK